MPNPVVVDSPLPQPTPDNTPTPPTKKSFPKWPIITFLTFLLGIASVFAYQKFALVKKSIPEISPEPTPPQSNFNDIAPEPDITADWKTYEDKDLGFTFKYPKDVLINSGYKGVDSSLTLSVIKEDLKNYSDDPMGFDLKTAQADQKSLLNGEYGNTFGNPFPGSQQVALLDNKIYAKKYIALQEIEICNIQFNQGLIFFKDNHQVIINFRAPYSYSSSNQLAEYFKPDTLACGDQPIWISPEKFYLDLVNQQTPKITQDWYNNFDLILSTFKFTDTTNTSESGYTCPSNGWQNCMPVLSEEGKKACSPEAMKWYETNCPNFQGAAL